MSERETPKPGKDNVIEFKPKAAEEASKSQETNQQEADSSRSDLIHMARSLIELQTRRDRSQLDRYRPYPKQKAFHRAKYREHLFMAGNQLGKTYAGAAEFAYHLTGLYPDWWMGIRFDRPIRAFAASVTREVTRDGVQRLLVGNPMNKKAWGTGMIPGSCFTVKDARPAGNVPGALAALGVDHISGGKSHLGFRSFDQGREKFQADTLDLVWLDEECPADIYFECLTRTNATGGGIMMTFTPLKGMSDVVTRFLKHESPDCHVTRMTIGEAKHISKRQRTKIIASYPAHERDARTKGVPVMGSGRVFAINEDKISVRATPELKRHLAENAAWINGIDFGWDHPTAGVCLAHDRDKDILYVTNIHRQREAVPSVHAGAIKAWGDWIPVSWPHDGFQHDKQSGQQLAENYCDAGLNMLYENATHEAGGNGVEAGIIAMLERMENGRLKVFSHLETWFEEFRIYHRKDGIIVTKNDDLMAATRYAAMMLRFAETKPAERPPRPRRQRAKGATWMSL